MNLSQVMERAGLRPRRHVPPIPKFTSEELERLRELFDLHNYDNEAYPPENRNGETFRNLFAQDQPVEWKAAETAFQTLPPGRLIRGGLLYEEAGKIRSHFRAQRYRDLILFSDFHHWETERDFVLPAGPAGHYLAQMTVRKPFRSALDLGCGCGIQSLLAASHCQQVTASDINPRALALTRLNAQLNGIREIEILKGSHFQPVRVRRFDLILANLPFYITPQAGHIYRDIQAKSNASILEGLRQFPNHLEEGGYAHVLINWVHEEGGNPCEPVAQALAGIQADVWLVHNGSRAPEEYIGMWADHRERDDPQRFEKLKASWLEWYRARGIQRVGLGALTLRKHTGRRNRFEAVSVSSSIQGSASGQTQRIFAMLDRAETYQRPDQILDEKLRPVDLEIRKDEASGSTMAHATQGQPLQLKVSDLTASLLNQLNPEVTPGEALQRMRPGSPSNRGEDRQQILTDLQHLASLGMLEVGDGSL